jgi:hypothetical protein
MINTITFESINANLVKFSNLLKEKLWGFVVVERNDKLPYAVLWKEKESKPHL